MDHFAHILGNARTVSLLARAASSVGPGHAYIIAGGQGTGKKTIANAFAKALQCEGSPDAPCRCLSCRVFAAGSHPDVIYVAGTKKTGIGIDDIRSQLLGVMAKKPYRYRHQIFIIDQAHTLTAEAQNALLKAIEEPAPHRVFMLLALHTGSLLPTVLSRCVLIKTQPLADARIERALTEMGIDPGNVPRCVQYAQGSLGRAVLYAQSEDFAAMRSLAGEITQSIGGMDACGALSAFRSIEKWKESIHDLLDLMRMCCRDAVMGLAYDSQPEALRRLFDALDVIAATQKALRQNGNFQLCIESMLLKLNRKLAAT